jgi:hypothetical protein
MTLEEQLHQRKGNLVDAHLDYIALLYKKELFDIDLLKAANKFIHKLWDDHKMVGSTLRLTADGELWWQLECPATGVHGRYFAVWDTEFDPEETDGTFGGYFDDVDRTPIFDQDKYIERLAKYYKEDSENA